MNQAQTQVLYYLASADAAASPGVDEWQAIATKVGSLNGVTITKAELQRLNGILPGGAIGTNLSPGGIVYVPVAAVPASSVLDFTHPPQTGSGQAFVFDQTAGEVFTVPASFLNPNAGKMYQELPAGASLTLDKNIFGDLEYVVASDTENVAFVYHETALGSLSIDTSDNSASFSIGGLEIALPNISGNIEVTAPTDPNASPLDTLLSYLEDLGATLSASDIDDLNFALLYPSGLPSVGSTLTLTNNAVAMDGATFSGLTSISGTGVIEASGGGTFNLGSATVSPGAHVGMVATGWLGTTLIGDDEDGVGLGASLFGDDTLVGGNGDNLILSAGMGVDTISSGNGANATFIINYGLAPGSSVTDNNGDGKLIGGGDVSGATLDGFTAMQVGNGVSPDSITMTAGQLDQFTTLTNLSTATVHTAGGGIYDLTGKTVASGFTFDIADDEDTTFTGSTTAISLAVTGNGDNTITADDAGADSVTVSGNGNNSVTLGDGDYDSVTISGDGDNSVTTGNGDYNTLTATGFGTNSLTAGDGDGNILTAENGIATLTVGDGGANTLTASTGGMTLVAGTGAGNTLNAHGGGNSLSAGNGGNTFNLYDTDNSATGGTGNDTFNLLGMTGSGTPSADVLDLAGTILHGGGGTDTITTSVSTLDLSTADVTGIEVLDGILHTLTLTSAQMAALTSLDFATGGVNSLNAATAGTYNLAAVNASDVVYMTDMSPSGGVTLINNGAASNQIFASGAGDVLTTGNGAGARIYGLGANQTITTGTGSGDLVIAAGTGTTVAVNGNSASVTVGSFGTATISGNSATVTAAGTGEVVYLRGTSETASAFAAGNRFVVGGGAGLASATISGGNQIYEFVNNFGTDTVNNSSSVANSHVLFGNSVTAQNLWLTHTGNNLKIQLLGTTQSVTLTNWFSSAGKQALDILASGTQLANANVAGIVTAMATYQSANPGFDPTASSMPSDTTLQSAITSAWASGINISDTAANIGAQLDFLQTLAAASQLTSITITNPSTALPITYAQLGNDTDAIALITGSYSIAVSGVSVANAATVLGTSHVSKVSILDTAANVNAALDTLQGYAGGSQLGTVAFTDPTTPTPLLSVTETQLTADAGALGDITSAYNLAVTDVLAADASTVAAHAHVTLVHVADSAAHVTTDIAALETLATGGKLASITLTGTPALTFDAADAAANADALALLTGTFSLTVSDSAANVASDIDALGTLAALGALTAITLTDSGTPTLSITGTEAQQNSAALGVITSPFAVSLGGDTFVTFTGAGAYATIFGSGNDIEAAGTDASLLDVGTGNNLLVLGGTDNEAVLYTSGDTVVATGDGAFVYVGSGANDVFLNGDDEGATLYGDDSNVTVNGEGASISLNGDSQVAIVNGDDATVTVGGIGGGGGGVDVTITGSGASFTIAGTGGSTVNIGGDSNTGYIYDSNDVINITGTNAYIADVGAGGNTIFLGGSDNELVLYTSDDIVTVTGAGNNFVYGGSGANTIALNGETEGATLYGSGSTIDVNGDYANVNLNGDSQIATVNGDHATIQVGGIGGGGGEEDVTITGSHASFNIAGTGDNTVNIGGDSNGGYIYDSDDEINITGTNAYIADVGTGGNDFTVDGNSNEVVLVTSGDTVTVNGDGDIVYNVGANTITFNGDSGGASLHSNGAIVTANGDGNNISISASLTGNTVSLLGTNGSLTDGGSSSTITLGGTGNHATISNSGTETISITGTGALVEFTGATTDQIIFDSGAIGKLLLDSSAGFAGTVAGFDGDDDIELGDFLFSGTPTISSVTGTGAMGTNTLVTITDGMASAQLALLNQFANQYAVSSSAYTLKANGGGGSADTLFQLAPGH